MINNEEEEIIEQDEIQEDDLGGEGNATASGKNWDSGVTRGKGNPISNHGNWESGAEHGRGNPVTTNEALAESLNRMKTIMGY